MLIDAVSMKKLLCKVLSRRSRSSLRTDLLRLRARLRHGGGRKILPPTNKLHFGCGQRRPPGWTNVDLVNSPFDIDLASPLPWSDGVFDAIASQQVIEHLDQEAELIPLLKELYRVARPGCEMWLSCPDLEKVCRGYLQDQGDGLLRDRNTRYPVQFPEGMPASQVINVLFHQGGEHKNLYDFALLRWLLKESGFTGVERQDEASFLKRFPEFPPRGDDLVAIYVRARRAEHATNSN